MIKGKRTLLMSVWLVLLQGCASVEVPRSASIALDDDTVATTYLGTWARQATELNEGLNGLALLHEGRDAFGLRASMAAHAQRTLDVQYYIFEDDNAGHALVKRMLHAAQRDVRVRLLLDDTASFGKQTWFAALDSHPNVEVRVFNPVPTWRGTWLGYHLVLAANFDRLHRRMHNKLWLADGAVGITGGRNLSDEYFDAADQVNFDDLDVLAVGPVVGELSDSFDAFWNHPLAIPLGHFEPLADSAWQQLLLDLTIDAESNELATRSSVGRFAGATGKELLESLTWAPAQVLWDPPEKLEAEGYPALELTLLDQLDDAFRDLERRLLIVSPYVVPTPEAIGYQRMLDERGVDTTIFTNSLEAMDHATLYGAYAPWRPTLLENGVRLFELRGDMSTRRTSRAPSVNSTSLHTKAMAFDEDRIFIGSLNADPRAVWWNSEIGLLIDSPVLGRELWSLAERGMDPRYSYGVLLGDDGRLSWHTRIDGRDVVTEREPGTIWQKFKAWSIRLLNIDHLL